jgi:hypothetical protein
MNDFEDKFLQRLEEEAAQWVEKELFTRMVYAKEAIQEQVDISQPEIGPNRANDHLRKALSFAQENLRMELEMEAQAWVDEEVRKYKASFKRD